MLGSPLQAPSPFPPRFLHLPHNFPLPCCTSLNRILIFFTRNKGLVPLLAGTNFKTVPWIVQKATGFSSGAGLKHLENPALGCALWGDPGEGAVKNSAQAFVPLSHTQPRVIVHVHTHRNAQKKKLCSPDFCRKHTILIKCKPAPQKSPWF